MKIHPRLSRRSTRAAALAFGLCLLGIVSSAQDRLRLMPGYERFQKISNEIPTSVKLGTLTVTWKDGGKLFEFRKEGKLFRYDVETRVTTDLGEAPIEVPQVGRPEEEPARGRQYASAFSPDKTVKAFYRDRNLWLSAADGKNETAVTTEGSEMTRRKYGSASWVYGEEFDQDTAMWWSPDGKKIAFYGFDESRVPDYYLELDQTKLYSKMDIEAYPKAGEPNPVVDILICDLASKTLTRADVRDGKPFDNSIVGHYFYGVSWSPDGKELLFHRTNRRQNIMELAACDPATGKCRVVVREEWPSSWTENSPEMRFLDDGQRFIWLSERTGWKNYYLYNLSGKLLATLTSHPYEVDKIVHIDETAGLLYYTARSGDNPMKLQLHRVALNGEGDVRLTDAAFNHTVNMSPDGKYFIDISQTHDSPPVTSLRKAYGELVDILAESDMSKFSELGFKTAEMFEFKAADGQTDLYGELYFPSHFDPSQKYPLLVRVYAGPGTNGASETFALPEALTEFGFLLATFDSRGAGERGKKFLDAVYRHLGTIEMDDQAAGVKTLWERPYVDKSHVGIYGTSYGGYAALMCLLRHPDVFQAASVSSAVAGWKHYDTIYTERYMGIPAENKEGYEAGNILNQISNLKGRLLLYYGTADNNVHPNNTMQIVKALQIAGKSFEVQVGPDQGHTSLRRDPMMEFFIENLVMR